MGQTTSSIEFRIHRDYNEAKRLLDQAEQTDFYVEECREDYANQVARKGQSYAVKEMTERDYMFFEVVIENAREKIPPRLRRDLNVVNVVQLESSADGGMPHTRPDALICYPDITSTFSVSTLLHELWHVHQRLHSVWWEGVFRRIGWEPWTGQLPTSLESHRRFNPDTMDSPLWCYRRTWIPVPIFREVARPKVTEVNIWFYHVSLKYHVKQIPREMEAQYNSLPQIAYEHPRELAAYLLSDPVQYAACPAIGGFREAVGADAFPLG